ncbi:MAG: hypothetical protein NXH97_07160 [Rhodobacteraceae bacterium]|nr:hypothetical protein [Paracoccaceae bacterium]
MRLTATDIARAHPALGDAAAPFDRAISLTADGIGVCRVKAGRPIPEVHKTCINHSGRGTLRPHHSGTDVEALSEIGPLVRTAEEADMLSLSVGKVFVFSTEPTCDMAETPFLRCKE